MTYEQLKIGSVLLPHSCYRLDSAWVLIDKKPSKAFLNLDTGELHEYEYSNHYIFERHQIIYDI
mgnify:CR=1 FL=1